MNAIIVVGIDGWEEYTLPALKSIRAHDQESKAIVVDADSEVPYPENEYAEVLHLEPSPSYAYALNCGIHYAGKCDWYLVLNNDVIAEGKVPFDDLHPTGGTVRQNELFPNE